MDACRSISSWLVVWEGVRGEGGVGGYMCRVDLGLFICLLFFFFFPFLRNEIMKTNMYP